jgi:hypothetical protein
LFAQGLGRGIAIAKGKRQFGSFARQVASSSSSVTGTVVVNESREVPASALVAGGGDGDGAGSECEQATTAKKTDGMTRKSFTDTTLG